MNTYEYIMERKRMCDSFGSKCRDCPANFDGMFCCGLAAMSPLDTKEQIAIVEKWSAEHPKKKKKTRQDVFLEQYPEALLNDDGILSICPMYISATHRDKGRGCKNPIKGCIDCCREFWMEEVKEDK